MITVQMLPFLSAAFLWAFKAVTLQCFLRVNSAGIQSRVIQMLSVGLSVLIYRQCLVSPRVERFIF